DLLQLDEVVAGTDRAEPDSRELLNRPGKLSPNPVDPAQTVDVDASPQLDRVDIGRIDLESLGGECRPLGRAADHLLAGQVTAVGRGKRIAVPKAPEKPPPRRRSGTLDIQRDQRQTAVERRARKDGANRVPGGNG